MRTVITGGLVLSRVGGEWCLLEHDILIENGRIAGLSPRDEGQEAVKDVERVDASGCLVAPGLINAHTHSPLASLRGTTDGLGHVGFMWRNQADTAGRSPEEVYAHVMAQALDALASGTTAMVDHFPEQNPTLECVDAAARAYRDVGIRATIALRVFDGAYDDIMPAPASGIVLPEGQMPLEPGRIDDLMDVCEESVRRWHGAEGRIAVAPGPSNPLRCSDDLLLACASLAERYDLGLHTHMLETKVQREISRSRHGVSNVAHLDSLGILSDRWSLAHCVWVDEDDIAALAASGGTPVHNPASNAKLGVGTAPVKAMLARGIAVALGTDGASTSDTVDMHEAAWLAALLSRTRGEAITAVEAFELATLGGRMAVRQPHVTGEIATGSVADLVFYRLDDPALSPLNDPVQQIVFAVRERAVCRTMVAGKILYEDGESFNERRVIAGLRLAEARSASLTRNRVWARFADAMAFQ